MSGPRKPKATTEEMLKSLKDNMGIGGGTESKNANTENLKVEVTRSLDENYMQKKEDKLAELKAERVALQQELEKIVQQIGESSTRGRSAPVTEVPKGHISSESTPLKVETIEKIASPDKGELFKKQLAIQNRLIEGIPKEITALEKELKNLDTEMKEITAHREKRTNTIVDDINNKSPRTRGSEITEDPKQPDDDVQQEASRGPRR